MTAQKSERSSPLLFVILGLALDRRTFLVGGAGALLLDAVWGQTRYPSKPVKLIVPFPPGQASDTFGRLLAQRLSVMWGQQVVVENRAGGIGVPAMLAAKHAAADGYTLVMGSTSTLSINPTLHPDLPYNVGRDFVPVSGVIVQPLLWVAHPSFTPRSIAELVDAAKKGPDKVLYASPGEGTTQHMAAELFASRAGIKLVRVPYKGSGPAMTDLLGGQVPLMIDSVTSALPHIKAGKIRAIAVMSARRVPQLPDVPTVAESGYPGFEAVGWAGIVVRAGTPAELVERISKDVQQVLSDPEVREDIVARGGIPDPRTSTQYSGFIRAETEKWGKLAKEAHIHVDE